MPRVRRLILICCTFCVSVVVMIELSRCLTQVNNCCSLEINDPAPRNITDLIMDLTRTMVKVEMWNYNYNDSDVEKLEDLLMEHGGTPVRSLIVSTWRSGSSFLGDLLNAIPSNFYNYEPLMKYGPKQVRGPPHGSNSSRVIKQMLKCNFSGMEQFYFNHSKKIRETVDQIQINRRLFDKCSYDRDTLCYDSDFVSKLCKLFPFQSMKTVRFRLPIAQAIFKDNELSTKVVLLVRDPRAVLHSRRHFCSGKCKNPRMLCLDMVKDYNVALKLSRKYPLKLMVLRYEDLILNLDETTSSLLKFLRRGRTPSIDSFIQTHTNVSNTKPFSTIRVSRNIPFKWKKVMNFSDVDQIQKVCRKAMSKWGYQPAYNSTHMSSEDFYPLRPYLFSNEATKQRK